MASLGELFVSLGFDVDSKTLKDFKGLLSDTNEQINKLGKSAAEAVGGITAAFAGVALFVQNSADGAVRLNNMAQMFGANAQEAQKFANALHQINSQVSVSAGQDIFAKFSMMVRGQIPFGEGAAGAISLLGGYDPAKGFSDQSAEQILSNFAKNYDAVRERLAPGQSEDAKNAAYQQFLDKTPLGPARAVIEQLAHNPEKYNAAGQYNLPEDQRANLTDYAKATAEFSEASTRFQNSVAAHLAPAMTNFFNAITALLNRLPSSEKTGDALLREKQRMGKLGFWDYMVYDPIALGFGWRHRDNAEDGGFPAENKTPISGLWSELSPANKIAITRRLLVESNMNPKAFNPAGGGTGAKGIAQWRADRQKLFKELTGKDLLQASLEEQRDFIGYELLRGPEKNAFNKLDNAQSEQQKYDAFTKYYERPGGEKKIDITINSTADAKTVAIEVRKELQNHLNNTNAQTNLNY